MTSVPTTTTTPALPSPDAGPLFLVGLGGIGMSGLAQLLRSLGYDVAGSDRETSGPGRDDLYARLGRQGITVWPQDGEAVRRLRPSLLIYSAAVEADNPDFIAGSALPRLHRALAQAAALHRLPARQIAIGGSCGKTSVTAWVASALRALGVPVGMVCGGYVREFESDSHPGNFVLDDGAEWIVSEADESDGSLVHFRPDIGVVLNLGTDHYPAAQLAALFAEFLGSCRRGCVVAGELRELLTLPPDRELVFFGENDAPGAAAGQNLRAGGYVPTPDGARFSLGELGACAVPQYGRHSMLNAAAVAAVLRLLGLTADADRCRRALTAFRGVGRRFDRVGSTPAGVPVFDDYAHNVEKIVAAIRSVREQVAGRPVFVIFQPHGYGPLAFMRDPLRSALATCLGPGDTFAFLPVYYAGGTSSFAPAAAEVAAEYAAAGLPVRALASRAEAIALTGASPAPAAILVLGARDPSLPGWCRSLVTSPA